MNSYEKRVAENLASMGAPASEWTAVATVGTALVEAEGSARAMPVFAFPEGFKEAPSLYRHSGSSACCNLCGEDIKNVFWIQNDAKRWVMPVGSECVTHFGAGLSGEEAHKQGEQARGRALLHELKKARASIWTAFATKQQLGYGRTETSISRWVAFGGQAIELRDKMAKAIGKNDPVESNDASITRWMGKQGGNARALVEEAGDLLARKTQREADEARRRVQRSQALGRGGLSL